MNKKYSVIKFFFVVFLVVGWISFQWVSHFRTNYKANAVDTDGQDITAPFYADAPAEGHDGHGGEHGAKPASHGDAGHSEGGHSEGGHEATHPSTESHVTEESEKAVDTAKSESHSTEKESTHTTETHK